MMLKFWDKPLFYTEYIYILYCAFPAERSPFYSDVYILNSSLIAPFNRFRQQEVNCVYNQVPKVQQVTCDRCIFWSVTVYNKKVSNQCNMPAQIEQIQDKHVYNQYDTNNFNIIDSKTEILNVTQMQHQLNTYFITYH